MEGDSANTASASVRSALGANISSWKSRAGFCNGAARVVQALSHTHSMLIKLSISKRFIAGLHKRAMLPPLHVDVNGVG